MKHEVGLTIIATIIITKNDDDIVIGPFNCDSCEVVSDVYGNGSSSFVLFERHVKDLIHRGKQWLREKISKDQGHQNIHNEFKILLNKKFFFKVQISMFNLHNKYRAYTMHKLTDDENVFLLRFSNSHQIMNNIFSMLMIFLLTSQIKWENVSYKYNFLSINENSNYSNILLTFTKFPKVKPYDPLFNIYFFH
uniref:Uncharacterized protein n=1 Tax=Lactuca sativa TaxID=4236 RepID=A0A9R1X8R7_LACSA|nr:hypothetical protein LSAT_V11C500282800 [Lactuca sativa]